MPEPSALTVQMSPPLTKAMLPFAPGKVARAPAGRTSSPSRAARKPNRRLTRSLLSGAGLNLRRSRLAVLPHRYGLNGRAVVFGAGSAVGSRLLAGALCPLTKALDDEKV